ncbi:MAG: hypothetical protein ACR2HJ_08350 [Fimbriimonadales bacterium]
MNKGIATVVIHSSYGMYTDFLCESIEVVDLVPATPEGEFAAEP